MSLKISIFGLPGAGKGTQSLKLAKYLNLPHISTGDIFRALKNENTGAALELKTILDSGLLVPDDLVNRIVIERLSKADCQKGFILDGFPRTLPQAKSIMASPYPIDFLINLTVDKNIIINRLSGRRICPSCGSIYHIDELGSLKKCKNDNIELIQRPDDKIESIKIRLQLFQENSNAVIQYFKEMGKLKNVSGEGSSDAVFKRIINSL